MNDNMNNKGFTFIELIVAIVILSIIVTGGYSLINSSYKVVTKQTGLTDMRNDLRIALIQITKDIQESEIVMATGNDNEPYVFTQPSKIDISYFYDDNSNKLFRKADSKQLVLIENVDSFILAAPHNDEQFELDIVVNGEKHNLIITRRIKGNISELTYGSIFGKVVDINTNQSIANAFVKATNETGSEYWSITNSEGVYSIDYLTAELYKLDVSATGYYPAETQNINIVEGEQSEVNISLTPIPNKPPNGSCNMIPTTVDIFGKGNNENYLSDTTENGVYVFPNSYEFGSGERKGRIRDGETLFIDGNLTMSPGSELIIDAGGKLYVAGEINGSNPGAGQGNSGVIKNSGSVFHSGISNNNLLQGYGTKKEIEIKEYLQERNDSCQSIKYPQGKIILYSDNRLEYRDVEILKNTFSTDDNLPSLYIPKDAGDININNNQRLYWRVKKDIIIETNINSNGQNEQRIESIGGKIIASSINLNITNTSANFNLLAKDSIDISEGTITSAGRNDFNIKSTNGGINGQGIDISTTNSNSRIILVANGLIDISDATIVSLGNNEHRIESKNAGINANKLTLNAKTNNIYITILAQSFIDISEARIESARNTTITSSNGGIDGHSSKIITSSTQDSPIRLTAKSLINLNNAELISKGNNVTIKLLSTENGISGQKLKIITTDSTGKINIQAKELIDISESTIESNSDNLAIVIKSTDNGIDGNKAVIVAKRGNLTFETKGDIDIASSDLSAIVNGITFKSDIDGKSISVINSKLQNTSIGSPAKVYKLNIVGSLSSGYIAKGN